MNREKTSSKGSKISVVVPLYNEEENVVILYEEIIKSLENYNFELIFVDDGSIDSTLTNLKKSICYGENNEDKRIKILEFVKNAGQSAAMYAGIMHALGNYIVLLDGDLQNDPNDIPLLINKLEKNEEKSLDLVCGYRKNRQDTLSKKIQSRIANFIRSRFTGDGIRDTGCSLKAMRTECRKYLTPFNGLHRFIPAMIANNGGTIAEVPVNHRSRQFGESKYGFKNRAFRATMDMFGVKWLSSRLLNYEIKKDVKN